MPLTDDPWIAEHSVIDAERLHALGMITLYWNHCERNLLNLFNLVFELHPRVGWIIAHDMGDVSMCSRIQEMLKLRKDQIAPEIEALLLNATKVYDVCRQNRNALTHFTILSKAPGDFSFIRTKGPAYDPRGFPDSLTDIRRVALETQMLAVYLWQLYEGVRTYGNEAPKPLPPLLDAPELLVKPRPQTHSKPKKSHPSSRKKPRS